MEAGPVAYIDLINRVTAPLPPLPIAELPAPERLAPLRVPLEQARIMLVSSAGVHERHQPPFQHNNDTSFRRLAQSVDPKSIRPSHPSPIRRPGLQDINVVFPYQRLAELSSEGFIAGPTEFHLSMQGAIKKLNALVSEMAPAMAEEAREAEADAVLLVPL
jgi:D-proline reductase (dithiol) PrdB